MNLGRLGIALNRNVSSASIQRLVREGIIMRCGSEDVRISFEEEEIYADTTNDPTFLSYKITAVASGDYELG